MPGRRPEGEITLKLGKITGIDATSWQIARALASILEGEEDCLGGTALALQARLYAAAETWQGLPGARRRAEEFLPLMREVLTVLSAVAPEGSTVAFGEGGEVHVLTNEEFVESMN